MKINARDIIRVLDENLKLAKNGGQAKNLYFLFNHDLIVDAIIEDWLKQNNINYILNQYPNVLWEENKQGILQKTEPPIYVVNRSIQDKAKQPFVFYFKLLNYGRDFEGDGLLVDLISKNNPSDANLHTFDLTNRMFTIASGFKEESGNGTSELKPQLVELFDVYEVDMDLQFILNYGLQDYLWWLDYYNSKDQLEEDQMAGFKEKQDMVKYIKKLIDSNFNIEDCSAYMLNNISQSYKYGKENTFESFIKALIDSLETDLKFYRDGTFASNDKIINDCKSIIDWLKKF